MELIPGLPPLKPEVAAKLDIPAPLEVKTPQQADIEAFTAGAGAFRRGFRQGMNSVGGMLNNLIGQSAESLGLTDFANSRFEDAKHYTQFADAVGPDVRDVRQVKDLQSLVEFTAGHAGSGVATTVPAIAAGIGLRRPLGRLLGSRNAGTAAGVTAAAGALEAGEQVQTLRDDPSVARGDILPNALVKGAIAGMMETAGGAAGMAARRLASPAKASLKGFAKEVGKGTVGEAVTEAGQDLTGQALHQLANPAVEIDPYQTLNAAAAGAAGGGLITGGAALGGAAATGLAKTPAELRQRIARRSAPVDPDSTDGYKSDDMEGVLREIEEREAEATKTYGTADLDEQRARYEEADAKFTNEVRSPMVRRAVEAGNELLRKVDDLRVKDTETKYSSMRTREQLFKDLGSQMLAGKKVYAPASNKEVADFLVKNNYKEERPGSGTWIPATLKYSELDGPIDTNIRKYIAERIKNDIKKGTQPGDIRTLARVVRNLADQPGALEDSPMVRAFAKAIGEDKLEEIMTYAIEQVKGPGPERELALSTMQRAFKNRQNTDDTRLEDVQNVLRTYARDEYVDNPENEEILLKELAPQVVEWLGSLDTTKSTGEGPGDRTLDTSIDREIIEKLRFVMGEKADEGFDMLEAAMRRHTRANRTAGVEEMFEASQSKDDSPYVDKRLGVEMTTDKAKEALEALRKEYPKHDVRFSARPVADKPGMWVLDASEADVADLDEAAWERVREKKGYHGLDKGVLTVKSYTRNKFGKLSEVENKINLVALTSEMMRQEKKQVQSGGARYVADMFSRGITALLTAKVNTGEFDADGNAVFKDRFRGFKAEDLDKLPNKAPVGFLGGKFYTWGDLRKLNFGTDERAVAARREMAAAKTPEDRAAARKRLMDFYDEQRDIREAATPSGPRFDDEAPKGEFREDVIRRELDASGKKVGGAMRFERQEGNVEDTRTSETLRGQTRGGVRTVEEDTGRPIGEGRPRPAEDKRDSIRMEEGKHPGQQHGEVVVRPPLEGEGLDPLPSGSTAPSDFERPLIGEPDLSEGASDREFEAEGYKRIKGEWVHQKTGRHLILAGGHGFISVAPDAAAFIEKHGYGLAHPNATLVKIYTAVKYGYSPEGLRDELRNDFKFKQVETGEEKLQRFAEADKLFDEAVEAARKTAPKVEGVNAQSPGMSDPAKKKLPKPKKQPAEKRLGTGPSKGGIEQLTDAEREAEVREHEERTRPASAEAEAERTIERLQEQRKRLQEQRKRLRSDSESFFSSFTSRVGKIVEEGLEEGKKLIETGLEEGKKAVKEVADTAELFVSAASNLVSDFTPQDIKDFPEAARELNSMFAARDPEGTENKIRRIYKQWQTAFRIEGNVLLVSDSSLAHLRKRSNLKSLSPKAFRLATKLLNDSTKGIGGSVYQIDDTNAVVYLTDRVLGNPVQAIGTAAHEFGHILDYRWLTKNADPEVRRALVLRFVQWLNQKGKSEDGDARYKAAMHRPHSIPEASNEDDIAEFLASPVNAWETSFTEWFAEQTAKYMMQDRKSLTPVEQLFHDFGKMVQDFLKRVRKLYADVMGEEWLGSFPNPIEAPDPIVKEYLDAHLAGHESSLIAWATGYQRQGRFAPFTTGSMLVHTIAHRNRIHSIEEALDAGQDFKVFKDEQISTSRRRLMLALGAAAATGGKLLPNSAPVEIARRSSDTAGMSPGKASLTARIAKFGASKAIRDAGLLPSKTVDGEMKFSALNIGRDEEVVTKEQEAEVRAYVTKVLGPRAKVFFEKMEAAGSFARLNGVETLKLSVDAIDPKSVAYHEALHALMLRLMAANPRARNVLMRAASAPHIQAKLRELLKDHPAALEQLKDPEERVAYMYQFWASGHKGLLNIGPETKTWFDKIKDFFLKVRAVWADDLNTTLAIDQAGEIIDAFHNGEFANPSTVKQVLARRFPDDMRAKMDKFWPQLGRFLDKFVWTAGSAVRDMNFQVLTDIMDKFHVPTETAGAEPGFIQTWRTEYNRRFNKIMPVFKDMTEEQRVEWMTAYRAGRRDMPGARIVQEVLDETYDYLVKAGVQVPVYEDGKIKYQPLRRVKSYTPRVPDMEYLLTEEGKRGFIELLERHGISDGQAVYDNYTKGVAGSNPREDAAIGLTFFAPQTNQRSDKMAQIPDEELNPYLSKDPIGVFSQYFARAARRAEYTRRFGNTGELIREARVQATKEGMTEDQGKTFDEAVQAMEGSLGSNMSDGLKAFFGGITTYQNLRLLPLAIFSSLVDPLGIAVRGGSIGDAAKAFYRGVRNLVSENKDEAFDFASAVGAIGAAQDAAVMQDLYSSQFMPKTQQRINDAFFRYNGMESWNRSMRTAASAVAEQFIIRHATRPGQHSARYLRELNLTPEDVVVNNGKLELNDKTIKAVNLWVDQAILRPNAAVRPIFMSDPHWMLVSHLKQYMYLFQKTIIARIHHEMQHGNYTPAFALSLYVPAIIASDMLRGILTPGGGDDREDWDTADWLWSGVQRAGIFGPGQAVLDSGQDMSFNKIGVESTLGPSAQQLLDFLRAGVRGTGIENELTRAIPGERLFR